MNPILVVIPKKLIVTVKEKLKDSMRFVEGLYTLESNQVNGMPYWIQHKAYWIGNKALAIWYEKEDGIGNWNIGDIKDLGTSAAIMYTSGDTAGPHEPSIWNTWHYFINHNKEDWNVFETTDVLISPAPGIFKIE